MECFIVSDNMRSNGGIAVSLTFVYGFSGGLKESLLAHFEG